MQPKTDKEPNLNNEPVFESELYSILSTPLTPSNIDGYADHALEELIDLTSKVVRQYEQDNQVASSHTSEVEDEAFRAYGLGSITAILEYVLVKSNEIKMLEGIIARADTKNEVITPPGLVAAMAIISGGGAFEKPTVIPRLKTVMLVLEDKFNTDLNDPTQFQLTKGKLEGSMMRQESYYLVETPRLERTMLVCDEEGNATYIFNDIELTKANITRDQLIEFTKEDIRKLLEEDTRVGRRLIYSDNFVPNLEATLEKGWFDARESELSRRAESYLMPPAPEGCLSVVNMARAWGVSRNKILRRIEMLEDVIGEVRMYKFKTGFGRGYLPEQQAIIKEALGAVLPVPETYRSIGGMAQEWGVSHKVVQRVVEKLEGELGEVGEYQFAFGSPTAGYSPEQQEIIKAHISFASSPLESH